MCIRDSVLAALKARRPRRHQSDFEAFGHETISDGLAEERLILDDQDPRGHHDQAFRYSWPPDSVTVYFLSPVGEGPEMTSPVAIWNSEP